MRVTKKGKIIDDFYVLGHANFPVYLLDGPKPALFDAGFMALAKCYEQDIKKILGSRSPAYLFLTHSHFDHVGAACYLKKVWPDLQIAGSVKCNDTLYLTGKYAKGVGDGGYRLRRDIADLFLDFLYERYQCPLLAAIKGDYFFYFLMIDFRWFLCLRHPL